MLSSTLFLCVIGLAFIIQSLPLGEDLQSTIIPPYHIPSSIRGVLRRADIISDVVDDFEPTYHIDVAYPKAQEAVLFGNDIPVEAVSKRPTFTIHSLAPTTTAKNSTFTLILTDPDATSRADPAMSEMCHWILTNLTTPLPEEQFPLALNVVSLQGLVTPDPDVSKVEKKEGELESYYPPAPPPKTGKHRYVFVLLQGSNRVKAPSDRPHWGYGKVRHGVRDWARDNCLVVVGANFFYAQSRKQ